MSERADENTETGTVVPLQLPLHRTQFDRLEKLKKRHNLTWPDVSALINISVSSIMSLKTGDRSELPPRCMEALGRLEGLSVVARPKEPYVSRRKRAAAPEAGSAPAVDSPAAQEKSPEEKPVKDAASIDQCAVEALDLIASRYRQDVGFLLNIICRDNCYKFHRAISAAPAAAVDDLRAHEGAQLYAYPEDAGTGARIVVTKLIGA